ncbi:MAG: hypothetical protein S4CHLAM20_10550 [Chlamydiia bacterium]|nr:hypothetical protein [Chlamydiia bacterium]
MQMLVNLAATQIEKAVHKAEEQNRNASSLFKGKGHRIGGLKRPPTLADLHDARARESKMQRAAEQINSTSSDSITNSNPPTPPNASNQMTTTTPNTPPLNNVVLGCLIGTVVLAIIAIIATVLLAGPIAIAAVAITTGAAIATLGVFIAHEINVHKITPPSNQYALPQ